MTEQVVYEMSLRDRLTAGLTTADGAAKKLEGTLMGVKSMLVGLGVGFAVFEGIHFVEAGIEAFHTMHKAMAQVEAALHSTQGAAGKTMKELEESAKSLASTTLFSRTDIYGMDSLLLTFTQVKDKIYDEAKPAIMDLATRMGGDLHGASIQVGKALNDPIQGINALRRVGVSFTQSQRDVIESLVKTNHLAEAQGLILKELNTEFGGSALAAAHADPMFEWNKSMGRLKMALGEAGASLLEVFLPGLIKVSERFTYLATNIKDVVHWFKEHKEIVYGVATAYGVYNAILFASTVPTLLATAATWALETAMGAVSLTLLLIESPIYLVIGAIALLAGGVVWAYNKFDKFRGFIWGVWEVLKGIGHFIKESIFPIFKGLGEIILGAMTFNPSLIKQGFETMRSTAKDAGLNVAEDYLTGFSKGIASKLDMNIGGLGDLASNPNDKNGGAADNPLASPTNTKDVGGKLVGNKSTQINVTIGDLIKEFTIQTTNISEGTNKVKELVAQALLGAVNDFQISSGV